MKNLTKRRIKKNVSNNIYSLQEKSALLNNQISSAHHALREEQREILQKTKSDADQVFSQHNSNAHDNDNSVVHAPSNRQKKVYLKDSLKALHAFGGPGYTLRKYSTQNSLDGKLKKIRNTMYADVKKIMNEEKNASVVVKKTIDAVFSASKQEFQLVGASSDMNQLLVIFTKNLASLASVLPTNGAENFFSRIKDGANQDGMFSSFEIHQERLINNLNRLPPTKAEIAKQWLSRLLRNDNSSSYQQEISMKMLLQEIKIENLEMKVSRLERNPEEILEAKKTQGKMFEALKTASIGIGILGVLVGIARQIYDVYKREIAEQKLENTGEKLNNKKIELEQHTQGSKTKEVAIFYKIKIHLDDDLRKIDQNLKSLLAVYKKKNISSGVAQETKDKIKAELRARKDKVSDLNLVWRGLNQFEDRYVIDKVNNDHDKLVEHYCNALQVPLDERGEYYANKEILANTNEVQKDSGGLRISP